MMNNYNKGEKNLVNMHKHKLLIKIMQIRYHSEALANCMGRIADMTEAGHFKMLYLLLMKLNNLLFEVFQSRAFF